MISAILIVFREMIEMALVLGVLLAATDQLPNSRRWIGAGAALGAVGASVVAWFMEAMEGSFDGNGEFMFNAAVLIMASLLIGWTVIWMQRHGKNIQTHTRQLSQAVATGEAPVTALAIIAMASVMREGSEAVFFLLGAVQATDQDGWSIAIGAGAGIVLGAVVAWGIYKGLRYIPLKQTFRVINTLLILLAAGMASQAVWNLVAIEKLPPLIDQLWDSSWLLTQDSPVGELLHALIGYDPQPSAMQILVFVATLLILAWLTTKGSATQGQSIDKQTISAPHL
ncbi:MAG: FTR1 family protein [Mariprofundales bacterium]|nr:FTR1 family protein [Mariprofundales bacterium]